MSAKHVRYIVLNGTYLNISVHLEPQICDSRQRRDDLPVGQAELALLACVTRAVNGQKTKRELKVVEELEYRFDVGCCRSREHRDATKSNSHVEQSLHVLQNDG